ncbi:MAG: 4a-hydroxytetrahydrobiopterin dehydratase [Comamonas sp.]|jgi:4a-hydroxytetrahydrobiopterin dehydratase|uniref:4a-hydroxytetrahydrobiopterin dehydratase n=1 Tax=Comamonas sp. TaxID=34028 RepID=UPI00281A3F12|nr:4a-hydroxytetrahydrobiopterin dehydratase [Comamonas sp.]MDR0215702.1 4a-hydroxytetrahydrobiopterin dehydratase [Comamonas sp.]
MSNMTLQQKDWSQQKRSALSPEQTREQLAALGGWELVGTNASPAIRKTYRFGNFYETMAFVNALALIAHQQDHHPDLEVGYNRCQVSLNTHDVGGISDTDIDCARRIEALLKLA